MTEFSRRKFLAAGTALSTGGVAGIADADRAPTFSGTVVRTNGEPAPEARVGVVGAEVEDESLEGSFGGYGDDADAKELPLARTTADRRGRFEVSVDSVPPPRRVVAVWQDDDGETWFSHVATWGNGSSEVKLTNHQLYGPETVRTKDLLCTGCRERVPRFAGTVTLWRSVDPASPRDQQLNLELTETASGEYLSPEGGVSGFEPWEITLDRTNPRYGADRLNAYYHPRIANALASFTVPERIGDGDVQVDYDAITVYEATGPLLLGGYDAPGDDTREELTTWHPARVPQVPAFTRGAARDRYEAVDLAQRLRGQQEANSWVNVLGTIGTAAVGLASSGAGLVLTGVGLVESETSIVEFDTGSRPDDPEVTVGEEIATGDRPSRNTHDSVDRLWVDPPPNVLAPAGQRPRAASVVATLPFTVPDADGTGEFFSEAVWDAAGAGTARFGDRREIDPLKHVTGGNRPDAGGGSDVQLGILLALSGELAPIAAPMADAAELPARQVAAADVSVTVETRTADTETDPEAAVRAARKLVEAGVPAVVGPASSRSTLRVAREVLVPNRVVCCSPSASSPEVADVDDADFVFRTAPDDRIDAAMLARVARDRLDADTAAVVFTDDEHRAEHARRFATAFADRGGTVDRRVPVGTDRSSYVGRVRTALETDPDLLVVFCFRPLLDRVLGDLYAEFDVDADVLVDGRHDPDLPREVGDPMPELRGVYASFDGPGRTAFEDAYEAEYGESPSAFTHSSYDAAAVLTLAGVAADGDDGTAVRDGLRSVANPPGTPVGPGNFVEGVERAAAGDPVDYRGAANRTNFDGDGDVTGVDYVFWRYRRSGDGYEVRPVDRITYRGS